MAFGWSACNQQIGSTQQRSAVQNWASANLATRTFANGDSIPFISDSTEWAKVNYAACCSYNNQTDSIAIYGLLYNWYCFVDPRGLCPKGWHVATTADWDMLVTSFGSDSTAARHLKGTQLWLASDYPGDNKSGLTFVPGGNRRDDGGFNGRGSSAPFWTPAEADSTNGIARFMNKNHYVVGVKTGNKKNALACRCVKD